ncbi:hypothetical protein DSO57_1013487 [Entomophthora muscae]|uniref:Uncharacterized protein n=1 Tax=Entomophthora muscae TaxID=34485 RepID=A0ACC2SUU1_9FUNG|nr:hypothetical protein DSO57_1013487 [Entomophthora muscae]
MMDQIASTMIARSKKEHMTAMTRFQFLQTFSRLEEDRTLPRNHNGKQNRPPNRYRQPTGTLGRRVVGLGFSLTGRLPAFRVMTAVSSGAGPRGNMVEEEMEPFPEIVGYNGVLEYEDILTNSLAI